MPKKRNRKTFVARPRKLTAASPPGDFIYPEVGYWEGVIGIEGLLTGDGRFLDEGSMRWETPMPIRYVRSDVGAHDGAEVAGRILHVERNDDGELVARGDFDMGSEAGREAYRQVKLEYTTGVSMDLDEATFQIRVAEEFLEEQEAAMEAVFDEDAETGEPEREIAPDGRVVVWEGAPDDEVMAITDALIRAATIVAIPAFKGARISAVDTIPEAQAAEEAPIDQDALVASAALATPPAEWFDNPRLQGITPITITDEGRIYGHLATWGVCHIGNPLGEGVCVEAPRSCTDYAYFHTGAILADNGDTIPVGQITMSTGHADGKAGVNSTLAHYDNTGTAVADVRAGEDAYGIWISGAIRSGLTADQLRELRAAPLSGDWRQVAGNLELVAALAVNVPGFPVPRPQGLVASGEVVSLVAAGMVAPESIDREPDTGADGALRFKSEMEGMSDLDLAYLIRLARRERKQEVEGYAQRVQRLRNQRNAASNREKIEAFAKGRA